MIRPFLCHGGFVSGSNYPSNNSTLNHNFGVTPKVQTRRSVFDRSYGHKGSCNGGFIIPIYWDLAYPGDTFSLAAQVMLRCNSALIRPVMDNWKYTTHFFGTPIRLLWDNFRYFLGEQDNPTDPIDFLIPQVVAGSGGFGKDSIYDYCNANPYITGLTIDNLVGRCYNLVWNQWFRDENLDDSLVVPLDDGPDTVTDFTLQRRRRRYDYFNQALPWPQKFGDVTLPLGSTAPVTGIGKAVADWSSGPVTAYETQGAESYPYYNWIANTPTSTDYAWYVRSNSGTVGSLPEIYADLSAATATTINEVRVAFTMQQFLEKDARGGTRFPEIIWSHFGVEFQDVRSIPEFLGGATAPFGITQIPQTSGTSGANYQGQLAGYGMAHSNGGHGFRKSFTEPTIVMGFMTIWCDYTYQQGTRREFFYQTRYDLFWPDFENLGEQAVLNQEIYTQGSGADIEVFGYIPRYDECRTMLSHISGQMRSTATDPEDVWHTAIDYGSLPTLSSTFMEESPPFDRNLTVESDVSDQFLFDVHFDYKCVRPMGMYGVPGLRRM